MAPAPGQGRRCRAQRKPLRLRDTMTLTELDYYSGNHPAAKAGSRPAFSVSSAARKDERTERVISASAVRRNHETARDCELSLDRQLRNELTGTATKKR